MTVGTIARDGNVPRTRPSTRRPSSTRRMTPEDNERVVRGGNQRPMGTRQSSTRLTQTERPPTRERTRVSTRPSTRERPSTRMQAEAVTERRTRPSTRGVKDRVATDSVSVSSRGLRKEQERAERRERRKVKIFKEDAFKKKDTIIEDEESSTFALSEDGTIPSRAVVQGTKRDMSRMVAPMKFMLAVFFALCIGLLAFGLLQGEKPQVQEPQTTSPTRGVEIIQPNTSTNTGILRGESNSN